MIVLSIGTDKKIFEKDSAVRARMVEYGNLFDELHIIVFSLKKHGFKAEKISEKVWAYPTNSISRFFYPFGAKKVFKKALSGMKFDVVTAQDPFETGLAGWMIARKAKIPLHVQIHTDFLSNYFNRNSPLNWLRIKIASFILPKAKAVRAVSERIRQSLSSIKSDLPGRTLVLPIYTDMKKFSEGNISFDLHEKYKNFSFIVLMVSRLTAEKNIPLALLAMRDVIIKYPNAGLVIVGDGPDKKYLKAIALKYNIDRNVVFESWQNDLVSYYRTADVFLTTSLYEGYGLTFIESAVSGCPIISTDVGIAPEIVENGKTGFICNSESEKEFSEKIIYFIENPGSREVFGEKLKNAAADKFAQSKERYLLQYKEMIEQAKNS